MDPNDAKQHILFIDSKLPDEARSHKEDWSGLSDPARRRKIQNRLHQRAWRRRQAEARRKSALPIKQEPNQSPKATTSIDETSSQDDVGMKISICRTKDETLREVINNLEKTLQSQDLLNPPRLEMLTSLIKFNIYRAMWANNEALRFDSAWRTEDGISAFCSARTLSEKEMQAFPENLRPTKLQRTIEHHPWIDLLPLPAMRDNILRLGDEYDDWPLCYDIIEDMEHDRSGLIVWSDPCNIQSWEVTEHFARKWAWVLAGCEELLKSTNEWRSKRGEPRLFSEASCKRQITAS